MGIFVGLGLRCSLTPNLSASAGFRYTDQRQETLPFLILAYSKPLTTGVTLSVTGSLRERWGDYEIDRLPEVSVQLTFLPGPSPSVSLQAFAGSITTLSTQVHTTRAGVTLDVANLFRLSPSMDVTPALRFGSIDYGTGQRHEFWVQSALLVIRAAPKVDLGMVYLKQDGQGTSPLLFDLISFDHTLSAWIGFAIMPTARVALSATANLFTVPSWTMKEYTLSWTRHGAWTGSLTWRVSDNRVLVGFSLAQ
ncbi:MAG: hypothetical protein ACRDGM_12030 [bacterium]